jgi:hypothetical protein
MIEMQTNTILVVGASRGAHRYGGPDGRLSIKESIPRLADMLEHRRGNRGVAPPATKRARPDDSQRCGLGQAREAVFTSDPEPCRTMCSSSAG